MQSPVLLGFLLATFSLAVTALPSAERLNVLFLAADDMRMQLGSARVPGTPQMSTPNFDKLVSKSLFLKKAQVQQAVCSPTRTSLLTSRYPDTTRVWDLNSYWRNVGGNFTTIPQFFKEDGYVTVGMGKIFHPGKPSGHDDIQHSWSTHDWPYFHAPNLNYWSGKVKHPGCDGCGNSWISVTPAAAQAKPLPDSQTREHAIQTLQKFKSAGIGKSGNNKPFFLAVGFHKPHLPFVAPERFFKSYPAENISLPGDQLPPKGMPPVAWSNWGELRAYLDIAKLRNSGNPGDKLPQAVTKALRRAYYASVSYTDYNVGQVLAALQEHGYSNNTVISFWGDHGWQLGEHGEWCKHTNFDLATNAPMMVHVPGLTDHGVETSTPTEFLDLMPTLVEAAAGKTIRACPPGNTSHVKLCTHGVSLLPLVKDPTTPIKSAAYSQYPRGYQKPDGTPELTPKEVRIKLGSGSSKPNPSACLTGHCTMGYSLLTNQGGNEYRYTEWVDFNTKYFGKPDWDRKVGVELYDHSADPMENVNQAASAAPALLKTLAALLRAHPVFGTHTPQS